MRKRALFAVAFAGLLGSTAAQSADVPPPVLKAPPALQASGWTGFYVGVQAGGGSGKARQTEFSGFDTGDYKLSGGLVGVTWGYNWQIGNTVVGFESDAAWSKISGSTDGRSSIIGPCWGVTPKCSAELQAFGTNRWRLGYAYDRWLPFIAGGMAWGYVHGTDGDVPAGGLVGSGGELHYGWTLGAGAEAMIDPHWSAKAEYLYADLRSGKAFSDVLAGVGSITESVGMRVHIVRVGLNYKFTPGGSLLPYMPHSPGPASGPWNWGGLYAGLNYGGGAGRASQSDILFDRGQYDVSGGLIGGTIGYNLQHGRLVYGVEADLDYSSIKGATSGNPAVFGPCGLATIINCETKLNWLGTTRARVGVAVDRLLPYVTAGAAFGKLTSSEGAPPAGLFGSGTSTRFGWTAGAGVEARLDDRWSAKLEYLYVDLGNREGFVEQLGGGLTLSENVSFRTHILRSGLNYKFN
jgi:outer membrane immunogenic protein